MFYYKIRWFHQDFKSENCFLNMYSVQAARILDLSLDIMLTLPIEVRNNFATLKVLPSCRTGIIFLFFKVKFINVFKMCWLALNFEICCVKFTLVIEF